MYLLQLPQSFDPKINLAAEEYIVRNFDADNDLLFIYRNDPSVIIGKNQNPFEETNPGFMASEKIPLYRRISGGGAVYHDPGNINFSYLTRNTKQNFNNYKNFLQPVVNLLKRKGVAAVINERNDIVVNGLKVSGNAQFSSRGVMFSHGTLLFNADLDRVRQALDVKNNIIWSKSTKSVRSSIANISAYLNPPYDIHLFLNELVQSVTDSFSFSGYIKPAKGQLYKIEKLAEEKYNHWEWNWGRTPKFMIEVSDPFSGHFASLIIDNGRICSKDLTPDDTFSKLVHALNGIRYRQSDIMLALDSFNGIHAKQKKKILKHIFPF